MYWTFCMHRAYTDTSIRRLALIPILTSNEYGPRACALHTERSNAYVANKTTMSSVQDKSQMQLYGKHQTGAYIASALFGYTLKKKRFFIKWSCLIFFQMDMELSEKKEISMLIIMYKRCIKKNIYQCGAPAGIWTLVCQFILVLTNGNLS